MARQYAGHTRQTLSSLTGIPAAKLGRMESGRVAPSAQEAHALATTLGTGAEFWTLPFDTEIDDENAHFRSRSAPLRERSSALAQAALLGDLLEFFRARLDLPECSVPDLSGIGCDAASEECRRAWGLSVERPLDNVLRVAEKAGVVISYGDPRTIRRVDAFSARLHDGGALIILNPDDPPSRNAFNIAHEIGHLALHHEVETGDSETEKQADRFASAFLMPRKGFVAAWKEGPSHPTLSWLLKMKSWWKVSVQALIRRARDLQVLPYDEYRGLCIAVSKNGWRKREPEEFDWPPTEFLRRCFSSMERYHSLSPQGVADACGLPLPLLARITGIDEFEELGERHDLPKNVLSLAALRRRAY